MSMLKYIFKRFLTMVPVIFGAITIVFFMSRWMPGNPAAAYLPANFTNAQKKAVEHWLGLDQPLYVQYFRYIADLFTGNWGHSSLISPGTDVWILIWNHFPRTMELTIFALLIASFLGIKAGLISAKHRNKPKDTVIRGAALIGVAVPVFWLGMLLQYFLTYQIRIFPSIGFKNPVWGNPDFITGFRSIDSLISGYLYLFVDYMWHLILPVSALAFISLASITRQTRSSMLEVLQQDYIRTARAKGCREKDVVKSHALKNALIPTITVIGLNFGGLLGGAVLTETTFNLAGMGTLMITAIQTYDYFVINATVFLTAVIFVFVNLFMDILYGFVDPRIRY
ncbi:Dipeptide transport system permease protein DppB [subsurface metagenome]